MHYVLGVDNDKRCLRAFVRDVGVKLLGGGCVLLRYTLAEKSVSELVTSAVGDAFPSIISLQSQQ